MPQIPEPTKEQPQLLISQTPRPKQSEIRSPLLQYHFNAPKRATSLIDLDPQDYLIEQHSVLSNEIREQEDIKYGD